MASPIRDASPSLWRLVGVRILLLVAMLAGGTVGYALIEKLSYFDAFYQTIITVSTVGFGESRGHFTPEGRLFTALLIIVGIGLFSWVVTSLFSVIVSGEVQRSLGRRRLRLEVQNMKDHFIVCGFGRLGRSIAEHLQGRGIPYVIIESDPEIAARCEELGFNILQGDATEDPILREARIEHARGLISVCESDATNVFITLSARQLNSSLVILARANEEGADKKLIRAGATRAFMPHEIGGAYMAQAAIRPAAMDFFDMTSGIAHTEGIQLEEVIVPKEYVGGGKTLAQLNFGRRYGVIVVGIKRAAEELRFNPTANDTVQPGDLLLVLGKPDQLETLEEALLESKAGGEDSGAAASGAVEAAKENA